MIYFDNSATTYPKPLSVINAVNDSLRYYSANPGRSGHAMSLKTAEKIFECRSTVCKLFNLKDESKVVFTPSCTQALNIVIKGILKPGDHCVISNLEHNSVLRPLEKLKNNNISYSIAEVFEKDDDKTVESFRKCINEHTKLVVCTHASNVFGIRLPVERICALCHNYGILFCLDAAQSAGVFDINIEKDNYDFVCCAGHKGLYGPMGVGILVINCDTIPDSLTEGGTGSESQNLSQPDFTPDKFESGTLNVSGICGLKKGIEVVLDKTPMMISNIEMAHIRLLYSKLKTMQKIKLYTEMPTLEYYAPVLSFNVDGRSSEEVASFLNKHSIAVRAGLHCAPIAHKCKNTLDIGTVRVSPSIFTKESDINYLVKVLKKL